MKAAKASAAHDAATRVRYRLGVYDPTRPELPIVFYHRRFRNTRYDKRVMRWAIREFERLAAADPADFRCISAFLKTTRVSLET